VSPPPSSLLLLPALLLSSSSFHPRILAILSLKFLSS